VNSLINVILSYGALLDPYLDKYVNSKPRLSRLEDQTMPCLKRELTGIAPQSVFC